MKKTGFFLVIFLLVTMLSYSQSRTGKDLLGKWHSDGDMFVLEFIDSSKLVMTSFGQKRPVTSYVTDFTQSPPWLDIFYGEGKQRITLKSIFEFVDENTIRWLLSNDNERPKDFTSRKIGSSVLVLTRKK
jgi:hypothetical protein